jgi:hypothetical protein
MRHAILLVLLVMATVAQAQTTRPVDARARKYVFVPKEMLEIPRVAPIVRITPINRYEIVATQPWKLDARNRNQFLESAPYGYWCGWWGWAPCGYPCWW